MSKRSPTAPNDLWSIAVSGNGPRPWFVCRGAFGSMESLVDRAGKVLRFAHATTAKAAADKANAKSTNV